MTTNAATEIDRTLPNSGLTIVFTTVYGAAYRCLACGAGTGVGAYDLKGTRTSARLHREESCPYRDAHHITATTLDAGGRTERYRTKSNGAAGRWVASDDSVASCSCGWKVYESSRTEAQAAARAHRNAAQSAWLRSA